MAITWNETCRRSRAFNEATEYWLANGAHEILDGMAQRCIEGGTYPKEGSDCWAAIKAQYPHNEVDTELGE